MDEPRIGEIVEERTEKRENPFFPESRTITNEEFDKLPRDVTFNFGMGRREDKWVAQIKIRGGRPSIGLLTNGDIRAKLDVNKLDHFYVEADLTKLTFPKIADNNLSLEQDKQNGGEYYIEGLSPRKLETDHSKIEKMDAQTLAVLIEQVDGLGLIFYTGAGISMGGEKPVWGMSELTENFGLEYSGDAYSDVFIDPIQNPPSEILAKVAVFGNQLFEDVSTPAHVAMAEIVRAKTESVIVTENIDFKHEAEGSRLSVIHAGNEDAFLKVKLRSSKTKMLITAGLSVDDRAIIQFLKQQNPDLKIVAFALSEDSIPNYLGENDAVILGNVQETLPKVAEELGIVAPTIREGTMTEIPATPREEELNKYVNEWGTKTVDGDGFEYYTGENIEDFLNKLAVNGYIQHGSTIRITGALEPHQGVNTANESSRRVAIYMTNNPPTSEYCALTSGKADVGEQNYSSSMSIVDGRIVNKYLSFQAEHPENMAEEGYVYIFDRANEDIEFINGEFLAYHPLEPMAVIKIKRSDFSYKVAGLPPTSIQ